MQLIRRSNVIFRKKLDEVRTGVFRLAVEYLFANFVRPFEITVLKIQFCSAEHSRCIRGFMRPSFQLWSVSLSNNLSYSAYKLIFKARLGHIYCIKVVELGG